MMGIFMYTIDLDSFFSDCSRDVAMAPNFRAKFGYMGSFGRVAFRNGLQYGHYDSKMFNGNVLSTSYASLMKINQVTPEITRITNAPF